MRGDSAKRVPQVKGCCCVYWIVSIVVPIASSIQNCFRIGNLSTQLLDQTLNFSLISRHCVVLLGLIQLFEEVLEYFNRWSYVFVGVYGYSYLESGKMVMELFRARGWTSIIADDLVGHVLSFTTFSVGVFTGVCSMFWCLLVDSYLASDEPSGEITNGIPQSNESYLFGPLPGPQYWALG